MPSTYLLSGPVSPTPFSTECSRYPCHKPQPALPVCPSPWELRRAGRAVIPAPEGAGSLCASSGPWALGPRSCLPCRRRPAILRRMQGRVHLRVWGQHSHELFPELPALILATDNWEVPPLLPPRVHLPSSFLSLTLSCLPSAPPQPPGSPPGQRPNARSPKTGERGL